MPTQRIIIQITDPGTIAQLTAQALKLGVSRDQLAQVLIDLAIEQTTGQASAELSLPSHLPQNTADDRRASEIEGMIQTQGPLTAPQIAQVLGVSRLTVDKALTRLVQAGRLSRTAGTRTPGRPGFPPFVYHLPEQTPNP